MSDRERFNTLKESSMSILKALAITYGINVSLYSEKDELVKEIIRVEKIKTEQAEIQELEEEKKFYTNMSTADLKLQATFNNLNISGMSKNEIINDLAKKSLKIKKENGKASSKARAKSPSPDSSYSHTAAASGDEYSNMSIRELKTELDKHRISYVGITDKNDLIYLLRQHKLRSKPPTPPPSPKYSKPSTPPKYSPPKPSAKSSSPTGTEDAGRVQQDTIQDEFTDMSVAQLKAAMEHYGIPFQPGMFKPDIKKMLRQAKGKFSKTSPKSSPKTSAKASPTFEQASSSSITMSMSRLREIFNLIDKDGSRQISTREFIKFINSKEAKLAPELFSIFGFPNRINAEDGSRDRVAEIIQEMDTEKTDQVDEDGNPLYDDEGKVRTRIGDGEISIKEMYEWLVKKGFMHMGGRRTQKNKKNKRKTYKKNKKNIKK